MQNQRMRESDQAKKRTKTSSADEITVFTLRGVSSSNHAGSPRMVWTGHFAASVSSIQYPISHPVSGSRHQVSSIYHPTSSFRSWHWL